MSTSVIVSGARTPIGRLMGSLKDFSAVDLGAIAIRGALEKANVPASEVEYVIMGQVLGAGAGQMPAKQTAVKAGIGWDVPALTSTRCACRGSTRSRWPTSSSARASSSALSPVARSR